MKYAFTLLLIITLTLNTRAQSGIDEDGIRRNAVAINRMDGFDANIQEIFKSEKLVLVGDLHGTAEPSAFVNYLAANLVGKGRNVYVGLEISPQDILSADQLHDAAALANCTFFKRETVNKGSQAWYNLVSDLSKMNGVHLFFFDMTKKQINEGLHHKDSVMYLNIKSKMLADTGGIYICLTNSYHSKITADLYPTPMGNYFLRDKDLKLSLFNMVSFNYAYVEGAACFNAGDGTRLHTLASSDYLFTLTGMRNFFSYTHELIDGDYNGVLFTYHATSSCGVE
jgi:hypothetical protein